MAEEKQSYIQDFKRLEERMQPASGWLQKLRLEAFDRFASLHFPTTHEEEWRFTNTAPLSKIPFRAVFESFKEPDLSQLEPFLFGKETRLVFVNGCYAERLSSDRSSGLRVDNLEQAMLHPASLEEHLARYAGWGQNTFTALNTAFLLDGAFVEIPEGMILEKPIHLLYLSTAPTDTVFHPRVLIVAGKGSEATIVESYISLTDHRYFSNAVAEVVLGEGSILHHLKIQKESPKGFHVSTIQVQQNRDSAYSSFVLTLGAELSRTDLNVRIDGLGARCTLNGLYLVSGNQHTDHHTEIDHVRPHGTSQELYKGILDGKSRAVFNGKIIVRKDAQRTDAKQVNKNLLLSDGARINTKPQLEILANDVKCNHGATIGHLEEEALFYLRSRGMSDPSARTLLMYGFVNDVSGRIRSEEVREKIERILMGRLQDFAGTQEAA